MLTTNFLIGIYCAGRQRSKEAKKLSSYWLYHHRKKAYDQSEKRFHDQRLTWYVSALHGGACELSTPVSGSSLEIICLKSTDCTRSLSITYILLLRALFCIYLFYLYYLNQIQVLDFGTRVFYAAFLIYFFKEKLI